MNWILNACIGISMTALAALCSASPGPYSPAAGQAGTQAISLTDWRLTAWATSVANVAYGENVDEEWQTPSRALGPVTGDLFDVVSLGEGGQITLAFDPVLHDGPGDDLAVFENSFSDTFLELAFVEISSDGIHFVRLPNVSLTESAVGGNGSVDTTRIDGLAGKYRNGYATGFDFAHTRGLPDAIGIDYDRISHVRLVDIVGDGRALDSTGHPVYDPYPTNISAGFDLEAIGMLDAPAAWFGDLYFISAQWYWSPWMGYAYAGAFPWLYIHDHGWIYCFGDGAAQWFWDPIGGWYYGEPTARPFVYSATQNKWVTWGIE
ncbi:MAG: PEP-CTERM sorting domain-containing protein [Verrucomicrobiota bacterium]|nr:PEP-CTERM sorting domain-containing protein [Verrucomicrobiota bacterium]